MTSIDIVLVLLIAGAFVLGFLWGVIRSLLMLGAWFLVFVVAALLSVPFGDYLTHQWNSYSADWDHMAAFAILYIGGLIASVILAWVSVRGPQGVTRYKMLDDIGSGALMAFVAVLAIAGIVTILATAYAGPPGADNVVGPDWTRDLYNSLIHQSRIGSGIHDTLVPALGTILGVLLPGYVREVMV